MTWFKIDDALHSHPKWLAASPAARALWVTAGSWCAAHLTDGHIPRHALPTFAATTDDATELVHVGLWDELPTGWRFHDWADFQPSAEAVTAERAASRERQRRFRESRRASRRDNTSDETENATTSTNPNPSRRDIRRESRREFGPPDPTRPDQYLKGGGYLQTAATDAPPSPRCSAHSGLPAGEVPPCGPCGDARRTYDAWVRQTGNGNGTSDPYAEQQAAARQRAEAGTTKAHEIASEPADPQAAAKIADLLRQHRLATRKDHA
jgi:hypothetical protein